MSDLPIKFPVRLWMAGHPAEQIRDADDSAVLLCEAVRDLNRLPLLLSIAEAAEEYIATRDEEPAPHEDRGDWVHGWYKRLTVAEDALDTALSAWREGKEKS